MGRRITVKMNSTYKNLKTKFNYVAGVYNSLLSRREIITD